MDLPIECQRLRQVRESLNETQSAFAQKLGIGNSTTDFERGRTKLPGLLVLKLLRDHHINPLWLYGQSEQKYLNPDKLDVSPKIISIDNTEHENILMVSEKAAAGYTGNISNPAYYNELPAFSFPLPEYRNATFRGFQVEGYSMTPTIQPREWIITKAIPNIDQIKDGNIYVIVETDSIRIKKVINNTSDKTLTLISTNPDYPTDHIPYSNVKEIWQFYSKLTKEIATQSSNYKLDAMHNDIKELRSEIARLKG